MLDIVAILLVGLWALALVNSFTLGGLIHVLLVFAPVTELLRVIQGARSY